MSELAVPATSTSTEAPVTAATPTTPVTPVTAATTTAPVQTVQDDRSTWIDPTKYRAAEAATNRAIRERDAERVRVADYERRLQALAGVVPKSPEAEEAAKIVESFYKLPGLGHLQKLTPENIERLTALLENEANVREAVNYQYQTLATSTLRDVADKVQDAAGYDFSPRQRSRVESAFKAFVSDLAATDPDNTKVRYEGRDPSLIADFVKEYTEDVIAPMKRQGYVATAQQGSVRVPRSGPNQPVVTQQPKPDLSKMTPTEMLEWAEKDTERHFAERER